jgi:uncharacterized protein
MRFWDASAIVPLCVIESHSGRLLEMLRQDEQMLVWWGTPLECRSALRRREREGDLDPDDALRCDQALDDLSVGWTEVCPTALLRRRAERLLGMHSLRAADALQLSAALTWVEDSPRRQEFVCLDDWLRACARKEGFKVVP